MINPGGGLAEQGRGLGRGRRPGAGCPSVLGWGRGRMRRARPALALPSLPAMARLCALTAMFPSLRVSSWGAASAPRVFVCSWVCSLLCVGVGPVGTSLGSCVPLGFGVWDAMQPFSPWASLPNGASSCPWAPQALSRPRQDSLQGDVQSGFLGGKGKRKGLIFPRPGRFGSRPQVDGVSFTALRDQETQ